MPMAVDGHRRQVVALVAEEELGEQRAGVVLVGDVIAHDRKAVVADLLVDPVEHRDVSYLSIDAASVTDYAEWQLRLITFSPNHDYRGAEKLDQKDPAWTTAQDTANAALKELQAGADFAHVASLSLGPGAAI